MGCSAKIGELPSAATTCSGRGECNNGTCICEIRYSGDECSLLNLPYHASVSSIFYVVALFSLIQLILCIIAEFNRLKQPSLIKACRITTQKLLYFVVCIAASLRGAYFTISTKHVSNIYGSDKHLSPFWKFFHFIFIPGTISSELGIVPTVSLLSALDDLCFSSSLPMGWGKEIITQKKPDCIVCKFIQFSFPVNI